jgi:endonuclease IV
MKRYWLFAGNDFYADGGFADFRGSFDTLEATKEQLVDLSGGRQSLDWYHVFDSQSNKIVDFEEGCYSGELDDVKQRNPELDITYDET